MNKQTGHQGFTLIELLVVVAIIAILATTILASLGSARKKAKLARVQSEISSMRAAAELTTDTAGNYPTGLFADTSSGMANLVNDVTNSGLGTVGQGNNGTSWGFSIQYDSTTGAEKYFCSDSSGYAGQASAPVTSTNILCHQVTSGATSGTGQIQ